MFRSNIHKSLVELTATAIVVNAKRRKNLANVETPARRTKIDKYFQISPEIVDKLHKFDRN